MERTKNYEKKMVTALFFAWGLTFFNRLSINFAMPIIQADLNLTGSDIETLTFVSTVSIAISAILVGNASDREGKRKKYLVPATLIVGIGSATSVLATSYMSFMIIRVIVGISLGTILSMILAMLEVESSER